MPEETRKPTAAPQDLLLRALILEIRKVDFAFVSIDNFTPGRLYRLRHFKDINRARRQAARLIMSLHGMLDGRRAPTLTQYSVIPDLSEDEDFQPIRRSILTLCRYLNLVHQYLTLRLTGFTAL